MVIVHHFRPDLDRDARLAVSSPISDETSRLVQVAEAAVDTQAKQAAYRDYQMAHKALIASAAKTLFEQGGYETVAEIASDDLDDAFSLTQNVHGSWSRDEHPQIRTRGENCHVVRDRVLGRKSTEVGDVFERDGIFFVVDRIGFVQLDL